MPPATPPRSATSAAALGFGTTDAQATAPRMAGGAMGQSGSIEALDRLKQAMHQLKAAKIQPLLDQAVAVLQANDFQTGGQLALQALELDERNGFAWYLLAIARERAGDFSGSVRCYESALALIPQHAEIANDLGRLAYRMGMKETAEKLFAHFLALYPQSYEAANNLACALRDQTRFDEAIEVLRPALGATPEISMLWNTLGTVVAEQGDPVTSATFFDEALRLEPTNAKALYNRGNARMVAGDLPGALDDCNAAMALPIAPDERQMMLLARSTIRIGQGDVGGGWDDYEARLHPDFADATHFFCERPRWAPGDDLAGKTLLLMGEQGLGDEILFANLIPDLLRALGPDGKLLFAVEPRLIPLFQRSFPTATVGPHQTVAVNGRTMRAALFVEGMDSIDLWTPMASLLRQYRRTVADWPDRRSFLKADPARVAHWRTVLEDAPTGPKVGLLWKSLVKAGARHRFFSPFEQWEPVLRVPGASFINIQYGDCSEEIAEARAALGVEIWTPPGIDLKQDLDDVAALTSALDLIVGPANATSNIAAACGAPTWLISTPGAWPRLGTDRYPWYPQARVFAPPGFGDWEPVMQEVAAALEGFVAEKG